MPAPITPEEIKAIRARYGLSQRSFATLLGIGPASIVRYENGAPPSKANANLIRAARNPQFMGECLEADGHLLPAGQRAIAQSVVYDYISLDPNKNEEMHKNLPRVGQPTGMTMSEAYHYTLQQEILNEQAANLIGELLNHILALEERGMQPDSSLELFLRDLFEVKSQIIAPGSDDDVVLERIRGHLVYSQHFIEELHSAIEAA